MSKTQCLKSVNYTLSTQSSRLADSTIWPVQPKVSLQLCGCCRDAAGAEAEVMRWRVSEAHTRIQPEKARGAAEILPGERRVFLEVLNEDIVQSLGHIGAVQNIRIYGMRGSLAGCVATCLRGGRRSCGTSVVHIRGDLDVAQQCVDW